MCENNVRIVFASSTCSTASPTLCADAAVSSYPRVMMLKVAGPAPLKLEQRQRSSLAVPRAIAITNGNDAPVGQPVVDPDACNVADPAVIAVASAKGGAAPLTSLRVPEFAMTTSHLRCDKRGHQDPVETGT